MAKSPSPLRDLYPRITSFPAPCRCGRVRASPGERENGAAEGDGLRQP
jgi:hypothetical protein